MTAHGGDLPAAALELAGRGWAVFPLRPGGKTPLIAAAHAADDPARRVCRGQCGQLGHGVHDATTTAAAVTAWWSRWPAANIGVACGPSALLVIDLDGPEALSWWRARLGEHGGEPTLTSATPRGYHLWYSQPPGLPLGCSAGRLAPGVDTRGAGGYVIAPPSRRAEGSYRWTRAVPVAELPAWVADRLRPTAAAPAPDAVAAWRLGGGQPALVGLVDVVLRAGPGQRNCSLHWAACRAGEHATAGRMDWQHAAAALAEAARQTGLGESEIAATLRSAARRTGGVA
jgi:hypothetical protein